VVGDFGLTLGLYPIAHQIKNHLLAAPLQVLGGVLSTGRLEQVNGGIPISGESGDRIQESSWGSEVNRI
jgi:hypothetical protein